MFSNSMTAFISAFIMDEASRSVAKCLINPSLTWLVFSAKLLNIQYHREHKVPLHKGHGCWSNYTELCTILPLN